MRIKNAFTLAETLIVMAIIGVLATITMVALTGSLPDKKKAMFKKGYSVIERTVGEVVNDETLYPFNREKIGFLNDESVEIPGTGMVAAGANKHCVIFANKLNTVGNASADFCKFETTDGIYWELPATAFSTTNLEQIFVIDVNGSDKGPNTRGDDVFQVIVRADGKIRVEDGSVEAEMLRSQTIKKEEKQEQQQQSK